MGRKPGFTLSEEQKARMQESRKNRKLGIIPEKQSVEEKAIKKRGRPKGFKVDPEIVRKQKETRIKNKLGIKDPIVYEKPILKVSRHWHNGFDFWPAMRNVLRPLHRYDNCRMIERMIVQKTIWQDREAIIKILQDFFIIEYKKLKENV